MKKIMAIGIGPGNLEGMTLRARTALEACEVVVGYHVYVEQVRPLITDQIVFENGMGQEKDRCEKAIGLALEGKSVAMVCSGDSGLYGMAGLLYELLERDQLLQDVSLEVIPGVTSALSCSSLLGAPIVEDFCTISLSDYMTDQKKIHLRLELAAKADFTMAIYNPRSSKRPEYLKEAVEIILKERQPETPVGIIRNAYREDQTILRTTLGEVPYEEVDMFCTLLIGNSKTRWIGEYMVTSRGYSL
ncbi:MAG: precorrin-3B C(17)-methyltransferase [Vallitaleaceae bacterium]|nr:precorrin-3B C(17)-methyltransferase [Vallitaleaceae bacterium]